MDKQMKNAATSRPESLEINLFDILKRRYLLILMGVLLGGALAALYVAVTKPVYESEISILVGQRSSELATSGTSKLDRSGSAVHEEVLSTHMELFASQRILSDAVERADLASLPSFQPPPGEPLNPVEHIQENLEVTKGGEGVAKNATILKATYRATNADDAVVVLNAIFDSYKDYVDAQSRSVGEDAATLIAEAQKRNEQELRAADAAYREFIASVPALLQGGELNEIHRMRVNDIEKELSEVRSNLGKTKSRLEVVTEYLDDKEHQELSDIERLSLLSEKEVTRLKLFLDMTRGETQSEQFAALQPVRQEKARAEYTRMLDLLMREKNLAESYGEEHPDVLALRRDIDVLKQFMEDNSVDGGLQEPIKQLAPGEMLAAYQSLLKHDVAELEKHEREILKQSEAELAEAKKVEADFLAGRARKADLDRAQERYDEVSQRLQQIDLGRNYAGFSTDMLVMPSAADEPAWPMPIVLVALGLFAGGIIGLGLAVTAEVLDQTFHDPNDLQRSMHAPILAHTPLLKNIRKRPRGSKSKLSPVLCTFHRPRSSEAEIFRVARTSVLTAAKQHHHTVLMVTSPHPGDGKSTIISNLAISLAQSGKRVLLVDADMRRPKIAVGFGIGSRQGLSDFLDGDLSLEDVVVQTEQENLSVITDGTGTSRPADLLESYRFMNLIEQARNAFDLVLIDTPPLLAVADPAIVAPAVDSCILTVRIKRNGRRPVERARAILADSGADVLGVVVNGSSGRQEHFGYLDRASTDEYRSVGKYHKYYQAKELPTTVNGRKAGVRGSEEMAEV